MAQNVDDIIKQYVGPPKQPPSDPFEDQLNSFSQEFQKQFSKPLPISGGKTGLGGIHKRLYKGRARDISFNDTTPEEQEWVIANGPRYGFRVGDFRKNWKAIGGSGPHIHIDSGKGGDIVDSIISSYIDTTTSTQPISITEPSSSRIGKFKPNLQSPTAALATSNITQHKTLKPKQVATPGEFKFSEVQKRAYEEDLNNRISVLLKQRKMMGAEAEGKGFDEELRQLLHIRSQLQSGIPLESIAKIEKAKTMGVNAEAQLKGEAEAKGSGLGLVPAGTKVMETAGKIFELPGLKQVGRVLGATSTAVAGLQHVAGQIMSGNVMESIEYLKHYGKTFPKAIYTKLMEGKETPGYEQPVAQLYHELIAAGGGDENAAENQLVEMLLALETDPVMKVPLHPVKSLRAVGKGIRTGEGVTKSLVKGAKAGVGIKEIPKEVIQRVQKQVQERLTLKDQFLKEVEEVKTKPNFSEWIEKKLQERGIELTINEYKDIISGKDIDKISVKDYSAIENEYLVKYGGVGNEYNFYNTKIGKSNREALDKAITGQPLEIVGFRQERGAPVAGKGYFYATDPKGATMYEGEGTLTFSEWLKGKGMDVKDYSLSVSNEYNEYVKSTKTPGGSVETLTVKPLKFNNPLVIQTWEKTLGEPMSLQFGTARETLKKLFPKLTDIELDRLQAAKNYAEWDQLKAEAARAHGYDAIVKVHTGEIQDLRGHVGVPEQAKIRVTQEGVIEAQAKYAEALSEYSNYPTIASKTLLDKAYKEYDRVRKAYEADEVIRTSDYAFAKFPDRLLEKPYAPKEVVEAQLGPKKKLVKSTVGVGTATVETPSKSFKPVSEPPSVKESMKEWKMGDDYLENSKTGALIDKDMNTGEYLVYTEGGKELIGIAKTKEEAIAIHNLHYAYGGTTVDLHAGFNPVAAIKQADILDIPQGSTLLPQGAKGSFKIEKPKPPAEGHMTIVDYLRSPLSNLHFKGLWERRAGPEGLQASELFRESQIATETKTLDYSRKLDEINQLLRKDVKETVGGRLKQLFNRDKVDKYYADFVDLIEKDYSDPTRTSTNPNVMKALELHDSLMKDFKDYIIDSRSQMGITTPPDWGITEQGYFRHLFLGDIQMMVDGQFIGTAETYAKAQKMALDILKNNPNAKIEAKARDIFHGDPTTRLSNSKYWSILGRIAKNVSQGNNIVLSGADLVADAKGIIGRKAAKQKIGPFLFHREGYQGYSKDYEKVMAIHAIQTIRSQEVSKLNRKVQPIIETLTKNGLEGVAEDIQRRLDHLWGTPTKGEKRFGGTIRKIPILRNYVANPDMAFRSWTDRIASTQAFLKLDWNIRSSLVNLLDPMSTLWPFTTSREMASLYAELFSKNTWKMLHERGVLAGATKLESSGVSIKHKFETPFRKASEINRSVGYLKGLREAEKAGHPRDSYEAHRTGLDWAKQVEFDNSKWNAPRALLSPTGKTLGQFKGYTLKQLELLETLGSKFEGETSNVPRVKRLTKFAVAKGALGGVRAITGPVGQLIGGYVIVNALSNQFQRIGIPKDEAEALAKATYYGTPSAIGQDLSGSVMILDPPFGQTTKEKLVNLVGGPTVSTLVDVYDKPVGEILKSQTPYARSIDAIAQLLDKRSGGELKAGKKKIKLSNYELVMRALGFTPLKQTEFYDKKSLKERQNKKRRELRKKK